jgi:hypothetical protein
MDTRWCAAGLTLVLGVALGAPASRASTGWQTIQDPKGRFTLELPPGWEARTMPDARPGERVLDAHAPGAGHSFPTIVVSVDNSPLSPQASAEAAEPGLRAIFHGYTVVKQGATVVGGYPAYYRYFTGRPGMQGYLTVYILQVYVTSPRHGFIMTGTTVDDAPHLRNDLPVIARALSSLRPKE